MTLDEVLTCARTALETGAYRIRIVGRAAGDYSLTVTHARKAGQLTYFTVEAYRREGSDVKEVRS